MEINELEDIKLCNSNLDDAHENLELAEAHSSNSGYDLFSSPPEDLFDNFLGGVEDDASPLFSEKESHMDVVDSEKESHIDVADNGSSTSKANASDSAKEEKQKSFFHLSDNMKKDLSLLTYPSKSQHRKKGIIPNKTIPASRITIAEALEKAKDASKSISSPATSDQPDVRKESVSESPSIPPSTAVDGNSKESQNTMRPPADSGTPEMPRIRVKKFDLQVTSESAAEASGSSTAARESTSSNEGQRVLLAGKAKSGTSRIHLTRRMWELLKFTFIHEHFPSSVHMARLAKMMGIPWSQVRNWFTDRRVENKKAGIYPRDRPLTDCPYCHVFLKTETEQKTHLFCTSHVKRVLGHEYCGGHAGGPSESIKWKKLPKTVNAVSSVSGARILAVGFSAEEGQKKEPEKKKMETAVGKPANSKELKKLWTDAMLLSEEKEQASAEWDSVRASEEKTSVSQCEPYVQRKRDTTYTLRMADLKEKLAEAKQRENTYDGKVMVNSRVASIPAEVGDVPSNISDSAPVTVNSATTKANTTVSSHDVDVVNTCIVSSPLPGDLHHKKHHHMEDMSALLESEMPRKAAGLGKKPNVGEKEGSSQEKPLTLSAELLCKAYKGTFPVPNVKPKNKSASSKSGPLGLSNFSSRENKSLKPSVFTVQDMEVKQEYVLDDSVNNSVVYKDDVSDGQNKYEGAVANTGKQSVIVNQKLFGPVKNVQQFQKPSMVTHNTSLLKSKSGLAVSKINKFSVDKRKDKLRAQPIGSVLRASRTAALPYEGNIIVGYQCPNCNKVYQTEWLMIKHSVTHFKYHCDICYKTYPTENMMKIHLLDHLTGAYEDEKYYCQFSCKICHSLKCGCYEPTYCKPQDLPRFFVRPQKARRSKKGFITKLNSGPNDHLKISLSTYKKLLLSESLGNNAKEKTEKTVPPKTVIFQDAKKTVVVENDQKPSNAAEPQKPVIALREMHKPNTPTEVLQVATVERESMECISVKTETSPAVLVKEREAVDSVAGVSGEQLRIKPVISSAEKDLIIAREKQQNWKRIKRKLTMTYERDATPPPQPPCPQQPLRPLLPPCPQLPSRPQQPPRLQLPPRPQLPPHPQQPPNLQQPPLLQQPPCPQQQPPYPPKLEEQEDAPGTKRGGGRKRTAKMSNNYVYNDTDFYYMCEICDASFACKTELSEHMFLHRLKSRSRGEKRGISWPVEEKVPKKVKVSEVAPDQASAPTLAPENYTCELCQANFSKAADYYAHKIMIHHEMQEQPAQLEVFKCNYCEKIYRRRRELKRHLKRDCVHAPSSLKGELLRATASNNAIEEAHYTTVKIDLDDRPEPTTKFVSRGVARGPIICRYCLAVTKREAEMKRHIWKFCLKVPADVVKRFMDGASLEELGFQYLNENIPMKDSPTKRPHPHTNISVSQSAVQESLNEMQSVNHPESSTESVTHPESSTESSPEKQTSSDMKSSMLLESLQASPTKLSSQKPPCQKISHVQEKESAPPEPNIVEKKTVFVKKQYPLISHVQESTPPEPNLVEKKTVPVHDVLEVEDSDTEKVSEMETSDVQPASSEGQSLSTVPAEESMKNEPEKVTPVKSSPKEDQPTEKQSPNKSQPEQTKSESSAVVDEAAQSATSTSPLASPVMQFPVVVPVMTASQKSKRPLVCGYCGIWYFREMAILKHMKERCIKIPEFEKSYLIKNSSLCNVAQKVGGVDVAAENGAVYKMVKMPEYLQNTPILVPKDVTNEDIKELNKNIKAYSESTPTEAKPPVNERVEAPPPPPAPAAPVMNPTRSAPGKKGSRCRRCHEHFSSQEAVLAHSSVHHGPKKGFYKCKLCHARLVKYKQLREHVWEHTNENPYRCHLCQVRYRSSDALVDHLLTKHQFTSINDKNLYKWLPGRHGKYRDIKAKGTDTEEKLEDVDTSLESVAEVMVITDKDICSKRDESKDTKGSSGEQQSEGTENIKVDNENLQKNSTGNKNSHENNCASNESKTAPESSTTSSDHVFDSNTVSENMTAHETDISEKKKRNSKESSGEISCDGSSVKQITVQERNDDEQTLPAGSLTGSRSTSDGEQSRGTVSEGTDVDIDAESGTIDNYTGEGLLPLLDNLDSVVETIQLTDKHLS